jgi:hypothetical protein
MTNSKTIVTELALELMDFVNILLCLCLQIIEIKELNWQWPTLNTYNDSHNALVKAAE